MGQRLNIEIQVSNDEGISTIANCYYHWSAYTSSSIELVEIILNNIEKVKHSSNPLCKAIQLLQYTGAGFDDGELDRIKNDSELQSIGMIINLQRCTSRNAGLIAITKEGIEETKFWEESSVIINLTDKVIDFGVFYNESIKDNKIEVDGYTVSKLSYDCAEIPFSEFDNFASEIQQSGHIFISDADSEYYIIPIE